MKILRVNYCEYQKMNDHKMVLVVNGSLKMTTGKIISQCCHACLGVYSKASSKSKKIWERQGQPKIVLKCENEDILFSLEQQAIKHKIPYYIVYDAGLTQVKRDSVTVCALGPAPCQTIDMLTKNLKLL